MAPLAMGLQMAGALPKGWQELALLVVAVCVFSIGRMIETTARRA